MARMSAQDQQKAKDAYSIHQDNLFWSRTQTLIAIQGGVIAGAYAIRDNLQLAVPLIFLGIAMTVILWIVAERDQIHRDAAFAKSGIDPTLPPEHFGAGRWLIRLVFDLMLFADAYLLASIILVRDDIWPVVVLHWLGAAFALAVILPTMIGMIYIMVKLVRPGWKSLFPKP